MECGVLIRKNYKILKIIFCMCLTVMMGSTGAKISSAMIADSSGGSSNIVGSINLYKICVKLGIFTYN